MIQKVIIGGLGYLLEYKVELGRRLLLPASLIVLCEIGASSERVTNYDHSIATVFLIGAVVAVLYAMVAISVHRTILKGPGAVPSWGVYWPKFRELLFVLYSIGLCIIVLPVGLLMFLPYVGPILAFIGVFYVVGRLSLVFPGIAIDKYWTFKDSWRATRGRGILMMVVVCILPIIVKMMEYIIAHELALQSIASLLTVLTFILTVAWLSVGFKVLTDREYES